jgi:hypothetical protein
MRSRWIGLNALGEGAGIAGVALAYGLIDRGAAPAKIILIAGAWEGLCLGAAQTLGLRPPALRWIGATVLMAVLGYAGSLGMGPGGGGADDPAGPPFWLNLVGGAAMGLVLGPLMGLAQALASRGTVETRRWVWANLVGWVPAMMLVMVGASLAERSWPLIGVAGLGALSGALAGLAIGLATSYALPTAAERRPV